MQLELEELLQLEELERFHLLELEPLLLEPLLLEHCKHHILELVCSTCGLLFHNGDVCGSHSDAEFCISLAPCNNCCGQLPQYWKSTLRPTPTGIPSIA